MKKTVTIILTITLILALAGCKKTNDTFYESKLSFAPVISGTEEKTVSSKDNSSDISVSSLEESKTNSSTVNPSSNVNSKVNSSEITVSTNNSNSSQTTIENKPTTYFEKMALKTITFNDNYCLNEEIHECVKTSCGIEQCEMKIDDETWANVPENEKDNYLYVNAIFNGHCGAKAIIAFDKYTGIVLNSCYDNAKYFNVNGNDILAFQTWGGGGDFYRTCNTVIPKYYDGLMFLVANEHIEYSELLEKQKNTMVYLNDIIDLKNGKYYIFAANR
ncbi:MAG: hypothetical protein ACI4F7_01255 [Acutalibacteraceae bacterium]